MFFFQHSWPSIQPYVVHNLCQPVQFYFYTVQRQRERETTENNTTCRQVLVQVLALMGCSQERKRGRAMSVMQDCTPH